MHVYRDMADQAGSSSRVKRDYGKGNWTLPETMVLIEAVKMEDERKMQRSGDSEARSKVIESKWKWIEDYCWKKGCHRSQNQCNDKWDNLMREFKKVREYERKTAERGNGNEQQSYWKLEKNVRREKNLPINMQLEIYDALLNIVDRKMALKIYGGTSSSKYIANVMNRPISNLQPGPSLPLFSQHPMSAPYLLLPLQQSMLPPQITQANAALPHPQPGQPLLTVDADTSEKSDSPAKRRKKREGEGSSGVGAAISKSASIIAETLKGNKERKERRHRELLSLHERRLKIEESKNEVNRQGINGLVDAISKLANSISDLATDKKQSDP